MKSADKNCGSNGGLTCKAVADEITKTKTSPSQDSNKKLEQLNSDANSKMTDSRNMTDAGQQQQLRPTNVVGGTSTLTMPSSNSRISKRERNKTSKSNKSAASLRSRPSETSGQQTNATRSNQTKTNHQISPGASRSSSGGSIMSELASSDKDTALFLDKFAKRAEELTKDICDTLERQSTHEIDEQPAQVNQLKDEVIRLSNLASNLAVTEDVRDFQQSSQTENGSEAQVDDKVGSVGSSPEKEKILTTKSGQGELVDEARNVQEVVATSANLMHKHNSSQENGFNDLNHSTSDTSQQKGDEGVSKLLNSDDKLIKGLESICAQKNGVGSSQVKSTNTSPKQQRADQVKTAKHTDKSIPLNISSQEFDPLNTKLDPESKLVALKASLAKDFTGSSDLFDQICRKLVYLSDENTALAINCERYRTDNQKLNLVKGKLENLCRELQKSNNSIRIESLDLIKSEQNKAKEQTVKIQSTLSGVIKLFHENQQRNMILRQENQELQNKLRALLEHCDNWSTGVDAALRKRDIENRLLKTELAKANLLRNEEKEKFLSEKQELLQIWSLMQEQQHKFEGQEAKLRSDLSSYASKYDECKAVISKGMNKFQTESKLMMKQIEKSRSDYRVLLTKYEGCNKRLSKLLIEKQSWDKQMKTANKKVETLEKLCRALRQRTSARSSDKCEDLIDESKIVVAGDEVDDNLNKQREILSNIVETSGEPNETVAEIAPAVNENQEGDQSIGT